MGSLKDNNIQKKKSVCNQNAFQPCHKYQEQPPHLTFTSLKPTMEPPKQCVECVQS